MPDFTFGNVAYVVGAVVGALLLMALRTSPDKVKSNASDWLRVLGFSPPAALESRWLVQLLRLAGAPLLLVIGPVGVWIFHSIEFAGYAATGELIGLGLVTYRRRTRDVAIAFTIVSFIALGAAITLLIFPSGSAVLPANAIPSAQSTAALVDAEKRASELETKLQAATEREANLVRQIRLGVDPSQAQANRILEATTKLPAFDRERIGRWAPVLSQLIEEGRKAAEQYEQAIQFLNNDIGNGRIDGGLKPHTDRLETAATALSDVMVAVRRFMSDNKYDVDQINYIFSPDSPNLSKLQTLQQSASRLMLYMQAWSKIQNKDSQDMRDLLREPLGNLSLALAPVTGWFQGDLPSRLHNIRVSIR